MPAWRAEVGFLHAPKPVVAWCLGRSVVSVV